MDFVPLPRAFYEPTAALVAPQLLGHFLVRQGPEGLSCGVIVETEAYVTHDPACHAAPGPTSRNRVMFGPPGYGYVYLIYGMHFCVNAVCCQEGKAEAVLIRAVEPFLGEQLMQARRPVKRRTDLTNGPAKVCQALGVSRNLNGVDLCLDNSPLIIASNPRIVSNKPREIVSGPRIGITKARDLLLRFYIKDNPFVSRT